VQSAHTEFRGPVINDTYGEEVETTFYYPGNWNGEAIVSLAARDELSPTLAEALNNGTAIAQTRLFRPGEQNRPVKNPREAPAYTYGYNRPLLVQRVHDVLTLLKFAQTRENHPVKKLYLHAEQSPYLEVEAVVVMTNKVARWAQTLERVGAEAKVPPPHPKLLQIPDNYLDANFVPGAARYGFEVSTSFK
jgi:hypothetical protein